MVIYIIYAFLKAFAKNPDHVPDMEIAALIELVVIDWTLIVALFS